LGISDYIIANHWYYVIKYFSANSTTSAKIYLSKNNSTTSAKLYLQWTKSFQ